MKTLERHHYLWLKLAVGTFMVTFLTGSGIIGAAAFRQLSEMNGIDCGCGVLQMPAQASPWLPTVGVTFSAAVIIGVFAATVFRIHASRRELRAMVNVPHRRLVHEPTGELLTILDTSALRAFTAGFFRPRIYISSGLIRRLTKSELDAVIRHEQFHRRSYDPLMGVILESARTAFGWMPWIRTWVTSAYSYRELAADAVATQSYARTGGLSGAILKFAENGAPGALAAFSPNTDRVDRLLDDAWQPAVRPWTAANIIPALAIVLGVLWFGRHTAAATTVEPTPACQETRLMCSSVRTWPGPTMTYVIPISLTR